MNLRMTKVARATILDKKLIDIYENERSKLSEINAEDLFNK